MFVKGGKAVTLFWNPSIRGRQYYRFQDKKVIRTGLSYHQTLQLEVIQELHRDQYRISSSEMEDMEAAIRTLLEAAFWMDWWFDTAKPLVMKDAREKAKVHRFFVTGTRTLMM